MTEQSKAENAISLSSVDGKKWTDINGKHVDAANVQGTVTRLVIGELGRDEEIEHSASLLQEALTHHGKTITHLHLWNLKELKHLEVLPPNLQCLDLRGCAALTRIPDLPRTLKTLDLEGCKALEELPRGEADNLQYLHLDACHSLPDDVIKSKIRTSPALRELTLSGLGQLTGRLDALDGPKSGRKDLRKLVLKDCSELQALPDLDAFELLNHLNLNGCVKLNRLPELPILPDPDPPRRYDEPVKGLRYLVTHGCKNLREYRGLDLREVHRSRHDDDNIIDTIRAFRYLGETPEKLVSSKLLLLGSGCAGKTTIAKALQWSELNDTERQAKPHLDPTKPSERTHGIDFFPWQTTFSFGEPDKSKEKGVVHIWDFAGQHIYHNVHRLFAASGSVFIIACCPPEEHSRRVEEYLQSVQSDIREIRRRENQYRPVRYWLDYVRSALRWPDGDLGSLPVILVHSGAGKDTDYITEQAGKGYEQAFTYPGIPICSIDCGGEDYSFLRESSFKELKQILSAHLAKSADELGIRVPEFYKRCHQAVENTLSDEFGRIRDAVVRFDTWIDNLHHILENKFSELNDNLKMPSILAVSRYLHNVGRIFWLSRDQGSEVIINQQLGAGAIYALCNPANSGSLIDSGGLISTDYLKKFTLTDIEAKAIGVDRLVHLLAKCDIAVSVDGNSLQAVLPSLLPEIDSSMHGIDELPLREDLQKQWFDALETYIGLSKEPVNHCFSLTSERVPIGEVDFQSVLAWAVRGASHAELPVLLIGQGRHSDIASDRLQRLRWTASYRIWRTGIQVVMAPHLDPWRPERDEAPDALEASPMVLRIQFERRERDSFEGAIAVELLLPEDWEEDVSSNLRDALIGQNGVLPFLASETNITDERPDNMPRDTRANPRGEGWPWKSNRNPFRNIKRHDVAISVRGSDAAIAQALHSALVQEGLSSYFYQEDEEARIDRSVPGSSLLQIYAYLREARCLVLICTDSYFDLSTTQPRKGNTYCPVELAGAVISVTGEKPEREPFRLIPFGVSWPGKPFSWDDIETRVRKTLEDFQTNVIKKRGEDESAIDAKEAGWIREALVQRTGFFGVCGRSQHKLDIWEPEQESQESAIQRLVDHIKRVLGKRSSESCL